MKFSTIVLAGLFASTAMAAKKRFPTEGNTSHPGECDTWIDAKVANDTVWAQKYHACLFSVVDIIQAKAIAPQNRTEFCSGECGALFDALAAEGAAKSTTIAYQQCSMSGGFGGISKVVCMKDQDVGGTFCPFTSWDDASANMPFMKVMMEPMSNASLIPTASAMDSST
jgi:hypothetical protein